MEFYLLNSGLFLIAGSDACNCRVVGEVLAGVHVAPLLTYYRSDDGMDGKIVRGHDTGNGDEMV